MVIGQRPVLSSCLDDLDLALLVAKDVSASLHVFGFLAEVGSKAREVDKELAQRSGQGSGSVTAEFEESDTHSEEGSKDEGNNEDEVEHDVEASSVELVEASNQALSALAGAGIEKLILSQNVDRVAVWSPVVVAGGRRATSRGC